jgi:hypothetical protein
MEDLSLSPTIGGNSCHRFWQIGALTCSDQTIEARPATDTVMKNRGTLSNGPETLLPCASMPNAYTMAGARVVLMGTSYGTYLAAFRGRL